MIKNNFLDSFQVQHNRPIRNECYIYIYKNIKKNIVQLDQNNLKMGSQHDVKKMLRLVEKGKYPKFISKF